MRGDAVSIVCTGTLPPAWGSRIPLVWLLRITDSFLMTV
jgi:hypothetical protein